jgi:hypothetical protein
MKKMFSRYGIIVTCGLIGAAVSALNAAESRTISQHNLKYKYLECKFDKTTLIYGFTEPPNEFVMDANTPDVLPKSFGVNDYKISFSSDNPFYSHYIYSRWIPDAKVADATSMDISINRVTGSATMNFFKEYGDTEKVACKKDTPNGPWCDYAPLTATKHGNCRAVIKRF